MRIGVIAPPWLPIPPPGYGGTEVVVDSLARGFAEQGHEVVLVAAGDSSCPVERRSTIEAAPGINIGGTAIEAHHVVRAYELLWDVEVIHDHTILGPLYGAGRVEVPIVTTNHNPFGDPFGTALRVVSNEVAVVAISAHHASTAGQVKIAAVIHHGVVPGEFPVGSGAGGYALFLGRMSESKGAHRAVRIAAAAGVRLILAGKIQEDSEKQYFDELVRPYLGDHCQYVGEIGQRTKLDLLSGASCLLNPIAWPEPFGMAMIEALACGTPVLALSFGAAPEIIDHERTGFLADDEQDLIAALARVDELDRGACRQAVEGHFSASRMVRDYLELFARLLVD